MKTAMEVVAVLEPVAVPAEEVMAAQPPLQATTVVVNWVPVGMGELTTRVLTGTMVVEPPVTEAVYEVTVTGVAAHPQATAVAGMVVAAGHW